MNAFGRVQHSELTLCNNYLIEQVSFTSTIQLFRCLSPLQKRTERSFRRSRKKGRRQPASSFVWPNVFEFVKSLPFRNWYPGVEGRVCGPGDMCDQGRSKVSALSHTTGQRTQSQIMKSFQRGEGSKSIPSKGR